MVIILRRKESKTSRKPERVYKELAKDDRYAKERITLDNLYPWGHNKIVPGF